MTIKGGGERMGGPFDELVEADRLEDHGAWEEAALLRLRAGGHQGHVSTRAHEIAPAVALLFLQRPGLVARWLHNGWDEWWSWLGNWEYLDRRGTESRWTPGSPPPWVRRAVEDAAALAASQALTAAAPGL